MSGSLGAGSGSSKNNSESQSSGYGYSGSTSTSTSSTVADAGSSGQSSSRQDIFAGDLYRQLYGGATNAAGRAAANAGQLSEVAGQLFQGGSSFLDSLGGDAGSAYQMQRLNGENPVLEEQIGALREDTGRLFSEQLNPAITSRAVAGGTLGGGRQGVAQGLAADSAARTFTQGATALRAADIAARDATAQSVAQNSLVAANTGLGALPGLLDIAERGNNQELSTYASLSSILGGPTALTTSGSRDSSYSNSRSIAEQLSSAFGEDFNESSSWNYGRSRNWNFDTAASLM